MTNIKTPIIFRDGNDLFSVKDIKFLNRDVELADIESNNFVIYSATGNILLASIENNSITLQETSESRPEELYEFITKYTLHFTSDIGINKEILSKLTLSELIDFATQFEYENYLSPLNIIMSILGYRNITKFNAKASNSKSRFFVKRSS